MDVQCERCKAEYEFDDALISGRGTTVKCTSCGYQFKIRRPSEAPDGSADRWEVRTIDGHQLVFTSLRDLQKAIKARQVGRADTLTRGGDLPRALGGITELEPFFDEAAQHDGTSARSAAWSAPNAGSGATPAPRTLMASAAVAQVPKMSSRPPPPQIGARTGNTLRPAGTPPPPPLTGVPRTSPPITTMRPRVETIRPPESASAAVPPPLPTTRPRLSSLGGITDDSSPGAQFGAAVQVAPVLTAGDLISESEDPPRAKAQETPTVPLYGSEHPIPLRPPAPKTLMHAPASGPPSVPPRRAFTSSPPQTSNRPPPPTITVEPPGLPPPTVPVRVKEQYRSASDDALDDVDLPVRPRRVGGWLVAVVLVLGAGVIGFAVAKPYLDARSAQTAAAAAALDPRAAQMLADGERALAAGDLEGANDAFTRASAVAEKDPRVLVDVARLANARADVPWLRALILPSDATDDQRAATAQLADLGGRAKKAALEASAATPEPPGAILAKIDALRISGDRTAARALVSKVIQGASQPETAYALAALDLAEAEPLWPMVIERLHVAVAAEGDAGRARAALVYALARSGDVSGAKAELDKLAGLTRPYPLVGALRAFVAKVPEPKPAASARAAVDVNALPHSAPRATWGGGGGGAAASTGGENGGGGGAAIHYAGGNDPRFLLAQAETAKGTHDYDRSRALYSSALAQNPSDSEALAGLGDVDHAQHNLAAAAGYYKRALAVNPVYLPALVGLGDVEWESGDRDEAQKTYRDVMDRFPEGTYPGRIRQRAMDMSGGVPTPSPATTAPPTAPTASSHGSAPAPSASTSDQTGASQ